MGKESKTIRETGLARAEALAHGALRIEAITGRRVSTISIRTDGEIWLTFDCSRNSTEVVKTTTVETKERQ